jgi:hypothetical protein
MAQNERRMLLRRDTFRLVSVNFAQRIFTALGHAYGSPAEGENDKRPSSVHAAGAWLRAVAAGDLRARPGESNDAGSCGIG